MSTRTKVTLGVFLVLAAIFLWGSSELQEEPPRRLASSGADMILEGAEVLSSNAALSPKRTLKVERKDAALALSAIQIFDWRGRAILDGDFYFSNASSATRLPLQKGSVQSPNFDWTHVLVVVQNHVPYILDRNAIPMDGGQGSISMPKPTFQAQVISQDRALEGMVFTVPFPWVDKQAWPDALQKSFRVPAAWSLHVDAAERSVYFVGEPGSAITIASPKDLLIETSAGWKPSKQYPPNSTHEVITLRRYPILTLQLQAGDGVAKEFDCRVSITLKGTGMPWHEVTGALEASQGGKWSLPFDPDFEEAWVTVTDRKQGFQLGNAVVKLLGVDHLEVMELRQQEVALTVFDQSGIGIHGALIVQAKQTLGVTDVNGVAWVPVSPNAGQVWFLARGFDASEAKPEDLMANPFMHLKPASGVSISCRSLEQATAIADAGRIQIRGLTFSNVLLEAPGQVEQVYHISNSSSVTGSWGLASTVFLLHRAGIESPEIPIAGVFEVEQETEAEVIFSDAFGQKAWSDSTIVSPNEVASLTFFIEEVMQSIAIRVFDDLNNPIQGANVSVGPGAGFGPFFATDSSGRASFSASTITDSLWVESSGFVSRKVAWPLPFPGEVIALERGRTLRVHLVDEAGMRMDASLQLKDGNMEWFGARWAKGVYQFESVPTGSLRIEIVQAGSTSVFEVPPDVSTLSLTYIP